MLNIKKTVCIAIGLFAAAFIAVGTGLSIYYTTDNAVDFLATMKTPSVVIDVTEIAANSSLTTAYSSNTTTMVKSVTPEYFGPVRGDLPREFRKTTIPSYYFYDMYIKNATFLDSAEQPINFPRGKYKVSAVRGNSDGAATMIFYYNNITRQKIFRDGYASLQISLRFLQTTFLSFKYLGELTYIKLFVFREK